MTLFLIGFLVLAIPVWIVLGILRAFGFLKWINKYVFLIPIYAVGISLIVTLFQIIGFFTVLISMSVGT